MASRTYVNFDLLFETGDDGRFRGRVVDSPDGRLAHVDFTLPFDATTLENLLLKLDPGRSGTRRGPRNPQIEAGRRLGGGLYEAVFTDEVALAWARSRDLAAEQGHGLRLRLRLGDAPSIAGLPWELLYDAKANAFIAQSERTPVVRFLDVPHHQLPLTVVGPLQILAVISAPTDLPELDVDAEWEHVQEALEDRIEAGRVEVHRLPHARISELASWLRSHQVHVLHFIGHGDYDTQLDEGVVYFCDEYGRSRPVTSSTLGPYVHDHDPLRLIVLNACRSASVDTTDPFGGMAQGLVQQQAAAVVAMQFPISDRAATTFTAEFYGAVADGFPVDQAVTSARKALWAYFGAEWATPTVFLHTKDGHIFDPVPAPAVVAATSGAAETPETPEPAPEPAPAEPESAPVATEHGPEPAPVASEREPAPEPAPKPGQVAAEEERLAAPVLALDHGLQPGAEPSGGAAPAAERLEPLAGFAGPEVGGQDAHADGPTQRDDDGADDDEEDDVVYTFRHGQQPGQQRRRTGAVLATAAVAVVLAVVYGAVQLRGGDEQGTQSTGTGATAGSSPGTSDGSHSTDAGTPTHTTSTHPWEPGSSVTAAALAAPPVTDGLGDDWAGVPTFQTVAAVANTRKQPGVTSTWALGWDASSYYLYVEVKDPTLTQTHAGQLSQLWAGDGVSFEFGVAGDRVEAGTLHEHDVHVMLGPTEDGAALSHVNVARGKVIAAGHTPRGQVAAQVHDWGYAIEAAIPWAELSVTDPEAGTLLSTNLNVSDALDTGARRGSLASMWSTNPERTNNDARSRSVWGELRLTG